MTEVPVFLLRLNQQLLSTNRYSPQFFATQLLHHGSLFLFVSWERIRCCCCSVAKQTQFAKLLSCYPSLWDPMDCSMPGFPVLHHLPEFAQIHVHWVGDAVWPSHSPLAALPFAFNLSQQLDLFQWVGCSHQVAKVLALQLWHQSFWWLQCWLSFRIDWFDLLALQGTLKSLFQHHDSKASVLQHSAFLHLFIYFWTFNFVLECSQLAVLWGFHVNSEGA